MHAARGDTSFELPRAKVHTQFSYGQIALWVFVLLMPVTALGRTATVPFCISPGFNGIGSLNIADIRKGDNITVSATQKFHIGDPDQFNQSLIIFEGGFGSVVGGDQNSVFIVSPSSIYMTISASDQSPHTAVSTTDCKELWFTFANPVRSPEECWDITVSVPGDTLTGACETPNTPSVVRLSLLNSTAQSNVILTSIEPGDRASPSLKDNTTLVAQVFDQSNQIVPNVDVELTADVVTLNGGHNHDDSDRHTNFSGTLAPVPGSAGVVTQNNKVLTGNTGSSGLVFTFTSPAFPNNPAGDHTISARCTGGANCVQQGPNQISVGIRDLVSIPASQAYIPITPNADVLHPSNHYLTGAALQQLEDLALTYRQSSPRDPVLRLNDSSLERGGLFDIDFAVAGHNRQTDGWWRGIGPIGLLPHAEHRKGLVIDIRANGDGATAIPQKNFKRFEQLMKRMRMTWIGENLNTSGGHYHVRLLGIAQ